MPRATYYEDRLFDSHCDLDFIGNKLQKRPWQLRDSLERDGLQLADKFEGCVANFVNPLDWKARFSAKLEEALKDPKVYLAIGCHPHYCSKYDVQSEARLRYLLSSSPSHFSALGECGLDYSAKNTVGRARQKYVFRSQIKIALEFNLPLVLHIREG